MGELYYDDGGEFPTITHLTARNARTANHTTHHKHTKTPQLTSIMSTKPKLTETEERKDSLEKLAVETEKWKKMEEKRQRQVL